MQLLSLRHREVLGRVFPVIAFCAASGFAFAQPQYTIRDLGQLTAGSGVTGINIAGQVIGQTNVSGQMHAFRTAPDAAINLPADDLGTLGGTTSSAAAINASGQVVGTSLTGTGQTHGFRTTPNTAINSSTDDLGTLGGSMSQAFWINNAGQVTGTSTPGTTNPRQAFLTQPNAAINPSTDDIGALTFAPASAEYSEGLGVNSGGHVSGDFLPIIPASYPTAFFYSSGTLTELAFVMAPGVNFTPLNDSDQIAFAGGTGGTLNLWQSGQTTQLATCGSGCILNPWMINDSAQIVGNEDSPTGGSFLFTNGTVYLLSSLVPSSSGWVFQRRFLAINDLGQIAGIALLNGEPHAFRLDPATIVSQALSQISNLISSMNLDHGMADALMSKLNAAMASASAGNTHAARNQLNAFENLVNAQAGKKLTSGQASQLIAAAEGAIDLL